MRKTMPLCKHDYRVLFMASSDHEPTQWDKTQRRIKLFCERCKVGKLGYLKQSGRFAPFLVWPLSEEELGQFARLKGRLQDPAEPLKIAVEALREFAEIQPIPGNLTLAAVVRRAKAALKQIEALG